MPFRPLFLTLVAGAATLAAAAPTHAEEGFLDRLFGGTPGAAPANPFASNYPSAPPSSREMAAARGERAVRRSRGAEARPVPPGRIPEE